MLQHRLAHDVADQLLDGARQVIVVDQGEELLEVDVPGNEVSRCLGASPPSAWHPTQRHPPLSSLDEDRLPNFFPSSYPLFF